MVPGYPGLMNPNVLHAIAVSHRWIPGIHYTGMQWGTVIFIVPVAIAAHMPWYPLQSRLIIIRPYNIREKQ